ncbi:uncharacterized protein BDZ83DRAFT_600987 [Colletotrichum acutatum]|uniref:Uncharacterized protein n=1 Tax=Glomerella acutata TaxID=27357 RepID=A0AAD8XP59_GLOAC|nr:uncharacterized protein BDZ83DRAFT_600987 [Colletotrichum acutatum]KAK1730878.1 hypothetical protein BDZ83DRAFT_600987 [Colletotrichum acutatum]
MSLTLSGRDMLAMVFNWSTAAVPMASSCQYLRILRSVFKRSPTKPGLQFTFILLARSMKCFRQQTSLTTS